MKSKNEIKEKFLSIFKVCDNGMSKFIGIKNDILESKTLKETHFISNITTENESVVFNFLGKKLKISFDTRNNNGTVRPYIVCSISEEILYRDFFIVEISDSYLKNEKLKLEIPHNNDTHQILLYCLLNNLASDMTNK